MAKLKEQRDAIKRVITMMEEDVGECMLLAESKKDLAHVTKGNSLKRKCDENKKNLELLEEQYSASGEKKRSYSNLFIYLIKYRIFFICSCFYNSVFCFYCLRWLWRNVCEYQVLYRNYNHSYCDNDVYGASDILKNFHLTPSYLQP